MSLDNENIMKHNHIATLAAACEKWEKSAMTDQTQLTDMKHQLEDLSILEKRLKEKDVHIDNLNAKIKVLEERMVKMMTSQSDYLKAVLKNQFDDKKGVDKSKFFGDAWKNGADPNYKNA